MRYNTLKNNIETKLCYLQIGEIKTSTQCSYFFAMSACNAFLSTIFPMPLVVIANHSVHISPPPLLSDGKGYLNYQYALPCR